jgi:hypothetical protein
MLGCMISKLESIHIEIFCYVTVWSCDTMLSAKGPRHVSSPPWKPRTSRNVERCRRESLPVLYYLSLNLPGEDWGISRRPSARRVIGHVFEPQTPWIHSWPANHCTAMWSPSAWNVYLNITLRRIFPVLNLIKHYSIKAYGGVDV